MFLNFQFWQHCRLDSEVFISGMSFVTFDADFEQLQLNTVNFLNIRTPKTFVVITLKFELYGSTIE